jgi:hypothetical protein
MRFHSACTGTGLKLVQRLDSERIKPIFSGSYVIAAEGAALSSKLDLNP